MTEYVIGGEKDQNDAPDSPVTLLDAMRQELKAEVTVDPITLEVNARPNFSVQYLPDIDMERIQYWQKRSPLKGVKDGIDLVRFSKLVLMGTCQGIKYTGKSMHCDDGSVMTFQSRDFIDMVPQAVDANGAMDWLFGSDPGILIHSQRVLSDAGYNQDGSSAIDADDDDHPLGKPSKG